MEEGFYWINFNGNVQIAYYTDGETEDLDTGRIMTGCWHLTQCDDICNDTETQVLEGPLIPPSPAGDATGSPHLYQTTGLSNSDGMALLGQMNETPDG